uniref:Clp R domain-containing protein n=1 Tax=Kalanchoe fedtschenkoi TaxID=63787 RepID=A0A7N0V3M5_KALFE
MRAGGCTVHQALSNDAATIIKQAVTLARRRGHAQVTPLHVASTMLSSSSGLLRTACLQSHSHPLQCKALELCFNVALNRLPTTSASPLLGHHSHPHPSISNALIAAFKRAQAHQRRGSTDNQQQPLMAVKIELEQLIISILDDPSVSRVMREADFSSTEVKTNIERVISLESCAKAKEGNQATSPTTTAATTSSSFQIGDRPIIGASPDVSKVMENMMNINKRNTIVVGECTTSVECVIEGVKAKVECKDVPHTLKDVKFTTLQSHSLPTLSKGEVEQKLAEIRSLVSDSNHGKSGLILFIGDLKWISDSWTRSNCNSRIDHQGIVRNIHSGYHPVEHMVMELGKLAASYARLWIMGVATFETYTKCRDGHPSIQSLLDLHAVTISVDNLALRLNTTESNGDSRNLSQYKIITSNNNQYSNKTSTLPKWLQQCKNEIKKPTKLDQECIPVADLCKKWNSKCTAVSKQQSISDLCSSEKTIDFSSVLSPSSSTSAFYLDHKRSSYGLPTDHKVWPPPVVIKDNLLKDNHSHNNSSFFISERSYPFHSKSYSYPNSPSYSDAMETDQSQMFSKSEGLNVDNLKKICSALEIKVPWQKDIIPEIASTVLRCRSGMVKRKGRSWQNNDQNKYETWLYFQGMDVVGKEKIARELARVIFGSYAKFVSISLSNFSCPKADSTQDSMRNKRGRDEQICSYIERFGAEVSCNPHRVFLVEDVEQADYSSQLGIKKAIERGIIVTSNAEEVSLCDAIIILSCESYSSKSRASSPSISTELHGGKYHHEDHQDKANDVGCLNLEDISPCVSLDLDLNISVVDDASVEDQYIDEIGILHSVDKLVVFQLIQGL